MNKIKTVYCQGKKGAYSHIASKLIFPKIEPNFLKSFEDVCMNVSKNNNAMGILPSENSTAGLVNGIIHLLLKYNLKIVYAKTIAVTHILCGKKGIKMENINKVFSHPQALLQCSNFLNNLNAEQVETVNTASSATMALEIENSAAVCSKEAAEIYGLEIIKENICNNKANSTRFIVVSNMDLVNDSADTVSIYYKVKNKSGSLYKILQIFADYNINLSSIHSLPLEDEPWNYGFYSDIEGNLYNKNVVECLKTLEKETEYLITLGNYISN